MAAFPRFLLALALLPGLDGAVGAAPWVYRQGSAEIAVDAERTGQIVRWTLGGKKLVDASVPVSPLRMVDASGNVWTFQAGPAATSAGDADISISGKLENGQGKSVPASLAYHVQDEGRRIDVDVDTPTVPDLSLREFAWTLPLSLNPRKRVFYLGDHGFEWDTRYFFQLTFDPGSGKGGGPSLLKSPDRNEWRFFGLDQLGPDGYRLWKAEGRDTSPLVMQEGRVPAPAVEVYDEKGGVLVEYPALAASAPKALRVDAAGGGAAQVSFYPDSAPSVPAGESKAFGPQRIRLTAYASEEEAKKGQADLRARYAGTFTPKPDPEDALREPAWIVQAPPEGGVPPYVVGGYPFPRGELRDVSGVGVEVAGTAVPVQAKAHAYWPDGSIKWALLSFPADAAKAVDDCPPPRISLASGRYLPVKIAAPGSPAASADTLSVVPSGGGGVTVTDGALKAEIGPGESWLRRVEFRGKPVVDAASKRGVSAYCDFLLDPEAVPAFSTAPRGGTADRGVLKVDKVEIEESGPLRGVVRLEGLTTNREPVRIVLRLEFLAGRPEIRVIHSAIFRFKDPRRTFLTGLGLDLPMPEGAQGPGRRVQLVQDDSMECREVVDGRPVEGREPPHGWMRVAGPGGGLTAAIRQFRETAPKALDADYASGRLRVELWPAGAAPMDVRRYSNFLHEAQLESPLQVPVADDWIRAEYYAKDPFYGVSRTHEMLLRFDDGQAAGNGEALAAAFQSPPLLYAGWGRYEKTGVVLPEVAQAAWPRAWDAWTRLARFFLYHRELHGWYGFWNFGDFRHRFRGGFGWTHPPQVLASLLDKSLPDDPGTMHDARRLDYVPPNDWNFDNGAYGWSNTEGLPGMFLAHEYLRHGNRTVYFAAEAEGRYARDVVTRQEGRWLGRGTRHGVQPWSDGNHEERQTTSTEYRLLYLLGGDGRSRDVLENLYRNVYTQGDVVSRAAHSARLGGLLFHWELTGDPAEGAQLARYVNLFLSDEGVALEPSARFPGPVANGKAGWLNSGSMFFQTFGGMHALIEYQQLTGDEAVKQALIRMAGVLVAKPVIEKDLLGNGDYSWPPIAFAALHAADPAPYRDFLRRYIEKAGWRSAYQPVTKDAAKWTGPAAFMTSPVALTFFWANWAPYVTDAIGGGEIWTPAIEKEFAVWENGVASTRKTGWQSDYDGLPNLESYLGPQQPWRSAPAP